MGVDPEINLAKRVAERRGVRPPIDIDALVTEFATIEYVQFPVSIDGLCLYLKQPGRKPKILVSKSANHQRLRFTLAHELGHILIPWHLGIMVDKIEDSSGNKEEREANVFASELLMPELWVEEIVNSSENIVIAIKKVISGADVSAQAACIRVINGLRPGFVIALQSVGSAEITYLSPNTTLPRALSGQNENLVNHQDLKRYMSWESSSKWSSLIAWDLSSPNNSSPYRSSDWGAVLTTIVEDVVSDVMERAKFKQSCNGVMSAANNVVRSDRSSVVIAAEIDLRLRRRAVENGHFRGLVEHALYKALCASRAQAFLP